jgi:hypothetical protein
MLSRMRQERYPERPARFCLPRLHDIPALFSEGAEPEPGRRSLVPWPKALTLRLLEIVRATPSPRERGEASSAPQPGNEKPIRAACQRREPQAEARGEAD